MRRREIVAAAAGAVVATVLAGSVAWAGIPGDGGVYTACMLKNVGTVRLIDKSLPPSNLMSRCKPALEVEISWSQQGPTGLQGLQGIQGPPGQNGTNGADGQPGAPGAPGQDGISVTSDPEPAGANCASGGSRFTASNGVTYACNGTAGSSSGWSTTGNAGTNPSTDYVGTSDVQRLVLRVNGERALVLIPGDSSFGPTIVGGFAGNGGSGRAGTVGGGGGPGQANSVTGDFGTVGGGGGNVASGSSATVGGGTENTASGSSATVPGGIRNVASGTISFAAGREAKATHTGSFVWADSFFQPFRSTADDEFSARARGGARFVTATDGQGVPTAGVVLASGAGSWSNLSDRTLKRNFAPVDGEWVLERLAGLPIATWSYKAQKPSVRHLGPTAQDFRRAFGLGLDSRHIDTVDSDGVSLAGIRALYRLVQAQQREIDALEKSLARLERARKRGSG